MNVLLVSPAGSNVLLMSHTGGGYSVTNLTLTFDDAAASTLPNYNPLTSGTNRPSSYRGAGRFARCPHQPLRLSALPAWMGWSPNGTWSLYVFDDSRGRRRRHRERLESEPHHRSHAGPVMDLAVGMTSAPASLFAGTSLTNTINITNFGPDSATGVVLTNPLPAGVNFVSASLSQGSLTGTGGGLVTCSLGSLPAGGTAQVAIVVMPTVAGALTQYGQRCGQ